MLELRPDAAEELIFPVSVVPKAAKALVVKLFNWLELSLAMALLLSLPAKVELKPAIAEEEMLLMPAVANAAI
jgi:hypothetical protein